jgi:hypothetical protein
MHRKVRHHDAKSPRYGVPRLDINQVLGERVHEGTRRYCRTSSRALKLDFRGVNVDRVGTTDSQSFKEANSPVLCLHSVTQETWPVINGSRDVWSAVSWSDYYDTHRFVSALLRYLDETLH